MTYRPANSQTAFLNTSIVFSDDESQRLYELTKLSTDIANYVNIREIGQFELVELLNGQQFSNSTTSTKKIFAYRKLFYFGAIIPGATLVIPHGIVGFTQMTHIYGTAITNTLNYIPIPYVSTVNVNRQIELLVDAVNLTIISGTNAQNITNGMIILEYLKN